MLVGRVRLRVVGEGMKTVIRYLMATLIALCMIMFAKLVYLGLEQSEMFRYMLVVVTTFVGVLCMVGIIADELKRNWKL